MGKANDNVKLHACQQRRLPLLHNIDGKISEGQAEGVTEGDPFERPFNLDLTRIKHVKEQREQWRTHREAE